MNDILCLENVINKNKVLNNEVELSILNNKENFNSIITNIIKKAIDYGIKSLNVNESNDAIFDNIKEITKGKDLKEIIKSCINISISQALENKKGKVDLLKELTNFKDICIKGGIRYLLTAGIDIVFNKFSKLNLFKPLIEKILQNVKTFIMSNSFLQKIDLGINKILNRTSEFKGMCKKWYKAYEEFNISDINEIAKKLDSKKNKVQNNFECIKENNIIQNITKLVNSKKDKLSEIQLQLCNNL